MWTTAISEIATVTLNICIVRIVSETGGGNGLGMRVLYLCSKCGSENETGGLCAKVQLNYAGMQGIRGTLSLLSGIPWYGALHYWNDLNKYFDVEVNSFFICIVNVAQSNSLR